MREALDYDSGERQSRCDYNRAQADPKAPQALQQPTSPRSAHKFEFAG